MAKAIVLFTMEVAKGIEGFALMHLTEDFKEVYGVSAPDKCDCVIEDIKQLGFQDWAENHLQDVPTESGIYEFIGKASFDEDSADYSVTCTNV